MGEALGRFGPWVGLGGWRAGVLGPGRGSDPWLVSPPNPQRAGPVLAMRPQQAPVSGKVFIQRDYSSGTRCQFQTKFPAELENRVRRLASRTCSGARERGSSGMGGVWADTGPAQCLAALGRGRQRRSLGQKRATKQDTMLGGGRVRPSPRCDDLIELCGAQCRKSVPSHPSSSLLPPHPHPGLLTAVMRN